MKHGSLFSGIGGFDLAAQWMGWKNIFQVEIDPWCQKLLKQHYPNAQRFTDIREFDGRPFAGQLDVISGGFPCQGFSTAGKRLGTDDNRYLWPEMLRVIKAIGPTWVCGENVTGILSMEDRSGSFGDVFPVLENRKIVRYDTIDHYEAVYTRQAKMLVSTICQDLEEAGYEVQPIAIPACGVGAPHKRERIWFIAHATDIGRQRYGASRHRGNGFKDGDTDVANTNNATAKRHRQDGRSLLPITESDRPGSVSKHDCWNEWTTEPPVCGVDDGIPNRIHRIKGLGNAVVPQLVYRIFSTIQQYENEKHQL